MRSSSGFSKATSRCAILGESTWIKHTSTRTSTCCLSQGGSGPYPVLCLLTQSCTEESLALQLLDGKMDNCFESAATQIET